MPTFRWSRTATRSRRYGVVRRQRQRGADDQIANSDPSLEDGEEKTATVTITDASGADHR